MLEIGGVTVMYRGKDLGKMRHNRRQQKDGGDHGTRPWGNICIVHRLWNQENCALPETVDILAELAVA